MYFVRYVSLAAIAASFFSGGALAADAAKGKVAFVKHGCYQCHGFVGQGGAGAKLAPKPMPQEAFVNFVRTTNR
jgi:mono/diheme cytochrome c family protein